MDLYTYKDIVMTEAEKQAQKDKQKAFENRLKIHKKSSEDLLDILKDQYDDLIAIEGEDSKAAQASLMMIEQQELFVERLKYLDE